MHSQGPPVYTHVLTRGSLAPICLHQSHVLLPSTLPHVLHQDTMELGSPGKQSTFFIHLTCHQMMLLHPHGGEEVLGSSSWR